MIDVDALLARKLEHNWNTRSSRAARRRISAAGPVEDTPELRRAHALAEALEPSVEGHGGDEALFIAASELATVLHEDAAAIAAVLTDTFNPRCAPPWPPEKLQREAERAAARMADPAARYARRVAARAEAARFSPARPVVEDHTGVDIDWTQPAPPIEWYCKGLAIAPSEAKVTLIGGDPGAGKGPLANYLACCFAFGEKAFGRFTCRECVVGILDFEGAQLSRRRIESHARGMGKAPADLQGRVYLRPSDASEMLDLGWLCDYIEERGIEVLIIDSYTSAVSASDIDPNSQEFAWLARELGKLGIVVIVVAHARKPSAGKRGERPALADIAGSGALGSMAATGIAVWKPDEDEALLARVGCMRAPDEAFPTFDLGWEKHRTDAGDAWTAQILGEVTKETREADALRDGARQKDVALTKDCAALLAHMRPNLGFPAGVGALAKAIGANPAHVGAVMAALARRGWAHHEPDATGRGAGRYTLDAEAPARVVFRGGEAEAAEDDGAPRAGGFSLGRRPR